jgi:CubicO group peptidase (beta-lactamase class C family)
MVKGGTIMKNMMTHTILVVVFLASMLPRAVFSAEYWPDRDWRTSTPEEQGIDSALIADMLEHIAHQQIDIHSFLLIRNGYLVTEVYVNPYSPEIPHQLFSCTKSIISALIGIARDEGYIGEVDQKMLDFFGEIRIKRPDAERQEITLAHLLTMTSGLKPTPSFPLYQYAEPIPFVVNLPMTSTPGEEFAYNSAAVHLLAAIIRQTAGTDVLSYAQTKLFTPLGISDVVWEADSTGLQFGPTGLRLTPRALAKLGYLYMQDGVWNGDQIISKEWIEESTQHHVDTVGKMNAAENDGYGYLWWMSGFEGFSAHGFGGQYLFVLPESEMIIVFTGALQDLDFPIPHELVKTYIRPSVKSSSPIASDSQTFQTLKANIEHLEDPDPKPVAPLPEIAKQISGKTFKITRDGSGGRMFTSISLTFDGSSEYTSTTNWPGAGIHSVQGGLDDVYRTGEDFGLKGFWQDEHTFVEYYKPMTYQIDTSIHTYTFDGNALTIDIKSSMGFFSFQSIAELVE